MSESAPWYEAFAAIQETWGDALWALYENGQERYAADIEASPEKYAKVLEDCYHALAEAEDDLIFIEKCLKVLQSPEDSPDRQRFAMLQTQHKRLMAGLMTDATLVDEGSLETISGVPLLAIGGIAFGVAAIAWAVVSYKYVTAVSNEIELEREELHARVQAMQTGLALQPSTLPEQRGPALPGAGGGLGPVVGLTAILALIGAGIYLKSK